MYLEKKTVLTPRYILSPHTFYEKVNIFLSATFHNFKFFLFTNK